jgi:Kef-type K+ transport system membrane component KefB
MSSQGFSVLALQLAAMLACAVVAGQLMRRIGQPAVLGEILGGIVLGPTIFGALSPDGYRWLFQSFADVATVRDASVKLGMLFFMFIAGLQVNLSHLRHLGNRAAWIGLVGTILPLLAGFGLVMLLPDSFRGSAPGVGITAVALFIGMNLANSGNSVIARILMDLDLIKTETGHLVMAATVVDDFVNWTVFALILSQIPSADGSPVSLTAGVGSVLLFFVVVLGVGRWLGRRALQWAGSWSAWPTGVIAVSTIAILLAGSFAEWAGVHAFLGAFLVGTALGNGGDEQSTRAQATMTQFVLSFFAPLYFVSLGLDADFITSFDPGLVLGLLAIACAVKIGAVLLGARLAGMPLGRGAWAVGFALNVRGATGLVLASVGLEYGLIDQRLYVALVVISLATSLLAVPTLRYCSAPAVLAPAVPREV